MSEQQRVGGRYELGEMLGRGGMAEVRKGTDIRLGRTVAVKRLRTDLASDATFQARFRREAQSAASLNHPAIVSVYDTGEELSEDGTNVAQPYIVMEYVAGRTLREILREGRKILPERALEIASGVLGALDYSHRAGIIHRDIKPGNVMLTPAGDVKVMDFGIARAVSDAQSTMTQTAAVVGTAQYLSPEQARGETVDSRSDVYSTGCLLFELLTGRPPFVGDSPVAVAYQHVREQAPTPSSLDADLPPEVDAIVAKALAKRLEDRYQSAAAMKEDIDRFLAGRPVQAPPVVAEPVPAFVPPPVAAYDTAATSVVPGAGDWAEEDRKNRTGPLVLLGLLLVAAIVGAILLIPHLIGSSPQKVSNPHVVGLSQADAEAKIKDAGLTVGQVTEEASDTVEKGKVISQSPDPDNQSFIDPKTAVDLTVSTGKPDVEIPDIIGDNKNAAAQQLEDLGLKVDLRQKTSDENKDDVLAVNPDVGTKVSAGSKVIVYFSAGPKAVPDVVGKTVEEATQILKDAGYQVSTLPDSQSTEPSGTVTQMSPPAGSTQNRGTVITLLVSSFTAPPVESPTDTPTETPTP
ncbi:Stk1 family PASTA domain-containing Ser/Thr kinase [Nocardioides marmorisolisilvae]|uniref:non-specific serine/threonine protein kinase n=1 Tax=Nocardioides marmorisolisilvae TaxID=1542737 RepID=A0A3N0DI24_9ACTN|nr:Stk1 family PASTA domain-containing Ser/Thr kinase [Nocardioides marmorisolisilvae]RNL75344.1 Stk1 family PASTA domain-containing Ser/Thr kinase [Nocardioides marmorisolisilvae]